MEKQKRQQRQQQRWQHQRRRSSLDDEMNRKTIGVTTLFGRCVHLPLPLLLLLLPLQCRTQKWNVFSWRCCCRLCIAHMHIDRPNETYARTHRYSARTQCIFVCTASNTHIHTVHSTPNNSRYTRCNKCASTTRRTEWRVHVARTFEKYTSNTIWRGSD